MIGTSYIAFEDIDGKEQRLDTSGHFNNAYNADCMEFLKACPDKFFNLAIVDPPYGGSDYKGAIVGRFGGRFENYHLGEVGGYCSTGDKGRENGKNLGEEISSARREYL